MEPKNSLSVTLGLIALLVLSLGLQPAWAPLVQDATAATSQQGEQIAASHPKETVTPEPTTPRPGFPVPANAIATPDGGYVTIPRMTDDDGKPLNIKYEAGIKGTGGDIVPACRGPSTGLYQEGANWATTSNSQTIGYEETWQMPTGSVTGNNVGFFYNPVNFWYPASGTNYDFFQVDFGIGNNLGSRTGWIMTYSYVDSNGVRQYPFTTIPATISAGSNYKVDAMLQPYPLANPSSYVVQITLGSNSWLYSQPLGYTPSLGSVYSFQSYQDQWLLSSGSSTLSADSNSSPKVIKDVSGSLVYDSTLVTGKTQWDTLNTSATTSQTRDILSPSSSGTTSFTDPRECSTFS